MKTNNHLRMNPNQLPITLDEILKNESNYRIQIWPNEECRDQGFSEDFTISHLLETGFYDSIEHLIESIYENCQDPMTGKSIMDADGSIELDELDNNGKWKRTFFHISPDSNYELENYQMVPNQ